MTRRLAVLAASTALALAEPALAQDHSQHQGMNMPGMTMPAAKKPAAKRPARKPAPREPVAHPTPNAPTRPATPTLASPSPSPSAPAPAPAPATNGSMPGMSMPPAAHVGHPTLAMPGMPQPAPTGMKDDRSAMPGMDMPHDHAGPAIGATSGMTTGGMEQSGTALPAGDAPAPKPPMDHYADRFFPPAEMDRARMRSMREQGGRTFYQMMFNLAEYQARNGRDGYRWAGEAFVGGDINRLWLKSEGEGALRGGVETAEVQALYSRAIGPYFNLQAGVRHDFKPSPTRTYATVGFEGLAPYMFEVEGALFLSNKGELLGRLEGYYDQRITQRLILQPRIELNLSAQDVPQIRLGSGLTNAEFGLRLRYEISRQFAPYVGASWTWLGGRTADYAQADGHDRQERAIVLGIRTWF